MAAGGGALLAEGAGRVHSAMVRGRGYDGAEGGGGDGDGGARRVAAA